MAIWPFNRRKKLDPSLPAAVETYTKSEHRERMGMAWLVGLVTLLVTAAMLAVLFFGGRWIYRKIAGKPKTPTTTQKTSAETDNNPGQNEHPTNTDTNENTNLPNTSNTPSNSNSSSNTNQNTNTQNSTSQTSTNSKIASTGPESTLSIFVAVTVISTLAYQFKLRRQAN